MLEGALGWLVLVCLAAVVIALAMVRDRWRAWWFELEDPRPMALYRVVFTFFLVLLFRLLSAGRYRRIDVGPEDGGDAVRRCFPDFPDDWGAALDARLAVMEPLDRLRSDLENGRPPRIDEATERAWAVCKDPMQMLVLLRTLGHASAASQLVDALPELPRDGLVVSAEWMRRAAAVVRARFPRIPACDAAGGLVR